MTYPWEEEPDPSIDQLPMIGVDCIHWDYYFCNIDGSTIDKDKCHNCNEPKCQPDFIEQMNEMVESTGGGYY